MEWELYFWFCFACLVVFLVLYRHEVRKRKRFETVVWLIRHYGHPRYLFEEEHLLYYGARKFHSLTGRCIDT